jgi:hypothetical protein
MLRKLMSTIGADYLGHPKRPLVWLEPTNVCAVESPLKKLSLVFVVTWLPVNNTAIPMRVYAFARLTRRKHDNLNTRTNKPICKLSSCKSGFVPSVRYKYTYLEHGATPDGDDEKKSKEKRHDCLQSDCN